MPVKRTVAPLLLLVLFATLLVQLPLAIADRASVYEWFDPLIEVRRILVDRYVVEPDEPELLEAAIAGMIGTLEDPHTQYVPPARTDDFEKILRGTYAGIGAEVTTEDGYLVIVSPMDDSPALRAGVMAGDVVLEIEGETTFEMPVSESVERLTGEVGTPVTITVRHRDGNEESITIVRERIVTRTVKGLRRIGEDWSYCVDEALGLAYVRVTQFNGDTANELRAAIDEIGPGGLGGLVLDLRDNPGGSLPIAVEMADLFLDRGTIVSVRSRSEPEVIYEARNAGTLPDFPMVVIVNEASASASEIIAGALQDNGRAKVLGSRTFGKGSVQEVRELKYRGGTLKFTTAHYFLPSGRNINRNPDAETWGVDPDPGFVVPLTDEEYVAMIRARRDYDVIGNGAGDPARCVETGWIREHMLDEQLASAVEALGARAQDGAWPALTDIDAALASGSLELRRELELRGRLIRELRRTDRRIDELHDTTALAAVTPLLPEDADLSEGTITLTDRAGNVIGTYRIEGGDVALALETITLEPVPAE